MQPLGQFEVAERNENIVLILVPSLIVLSLMLYLDTPSPLLVAAQILLFAVTIIVYTIFNMVSMALLEKRKSKELRENFLTMKTTPNKAERNQNVKSHLRLK